MEYRALESRGGMVWIPTLYLSCSMFEGQPRAGRYSSVPTLKQGIPLFLLHHLHFVINLFLMLPKPFFIPRQESLHRSFTFHWIMSVLCGPIIFH